MKNLKLIVTAYLIIFASCSYAQSLSFKDKSFKIEEFPEYVIINCDNLNPVLANSINIVIQAKNSKFEKSLKGLQDFFEGNKYLKIRNQTDLLNAMSELGFDYVDAFPQNSPENSAFSRTGFVFRKKEKYRS
jgi:hypothetical protein